MTHPVKRKQSMTSDEPAARKLRTILVDDEELARRAVRRIVKDIGGVEIIAECADGVAALRLIRELSPDVVCLDISMPKLGGFDVVRALDEPERPHIIFMTAFDEHAIRAFEMHAVDYLVKPVDPERAKRAFCEIERRRSQEQRALRYDELLRSLKRFTGLEDTGEKLGILDDRHYASRVMVRTEGRMYFVPTAEIDWVEANRNNMRLHVGAEVHVIRQPLATLLDILDPKVFARIHRSTIVNLLRVKEVQPWFSGDSVVTLRDGSRLRLSRHFRESMERQLRG
jgi:two-component system LytT family response regulator